MPRILPSPGLERTSQMPGLPEPDSPPIVQPYFSTTQVGEFFFSQALKPARAVVPMAVSDKWIFDFIDAGVRIASTGKEVA